jgi:hypothetical protein
MLALYEFFLYLEFGGSDSVITLPISTNEFSPISIPFRITVPEPRKVPCPIL